MSVLSRIESCIRANRFETRVWQAGDGRLLLTPYSARLVACEIEGVEGNLFWHDPKLESGNDSGGCLDTAGPFGGDRLWVAPEVGFIFVDRQLVRTDPAAAAKLPPQMDPGDYRIVEDKTETPASLALTAEMRLTDHRFKRDIAFRVDRRFSVIDRPDDLPRSLRCASFAVRNDLTLLEADQAGMVGGAWELLQLPPTGTLICPLTHPIDSPRRYFDAFDAQHVRSDRDAVRFLIDGKKRQKMGLSPTQTLGRLGYYRRVGGVSTFVFRGFLAAPGEPYVDVTLDSEETSGGDALQAYNDDGRFGGFGEMEFHDPAIVVGRTPETRSGTSVTHVIAGPDSEVRAYGTHLLGAEVRE